MALSTSYNDCARGGIDAFEVVSSDYQYEEGHQAPPTIDIPRGGSSIFSAEEQNHQSIDAVQTVETNQNQKGFPLDITEHYLILNLHKYEINN